MSYKAELLEHFERIAKASAKKAKAKARPKRPVPPTVPLPRFAPGLKVYTLSGPFPQVMSTYVEQAQWGGSEWVYKLPGLESLVSEKALFRMLHELEAAALGRPVISHKDMASSS